jgi:thiamine-monophosphate kinase
MDEFEIIRRYFNRDTPMDGVVTGIGDDGAVLLADATRQQVQVIDTLVAGVHFPPTTNAADIAFRAVAVNLSDIAAMGATPRWMTLALTLNTADEQWLGDFAVGLFAAADAHNVALVGGDTTRGPVVTVTVSITGEVEQGAALLRSGAQIGDGIFVTGTLGDAAAGLQLLQVGQPETYLTARFLRPTPRIDTAQLLSGIATAAIDISDGLVGDLSKLLKASGVGGEIEVEKLPLSEALQARFDTTAQRKFALYGGDDYELCFTASRSDLDEIAGITRIGRVSGESGLVGLGNGDIVELSDSGYRHFQ